jgi:uncharacterized protein DUF3515
VVVGLAIAAIAGIGTSNTPSNPVTGAVLPPVSLSAPPNAAAEAAPCAQVLAQLPVQLGRLAGRVVHTEPDTPFVVAWGDPPVILACGVDRPKDLVPGSSAQFFANGPQAGPYYDVTSAGGENVWTTVDRAPYIAITVPSQYQGADVIPPLSRAIARALPAVCTTDSSTPDPAKLCTRRK